MPHTYTGRKKYLNSKGGVIFQYHIYDAHKYFLKTLKNIIFHSSFPKKFPSVYVLCALLIAFRGRTSFHLLSPNGDFVAGVHRRFQLAEEHRLEAAGKLELHQALLQEEGHVVAALGALGGCQHDQSIGSPSSHLQLDVHGQNGVQGLVLANVLVDAMRHIGIARECGIPDNDG